ncbi:MAG: hypothetical protein FD180_405 [Planctomycetota bacterium]|nr:MAG: hypothetical protein FD180_405 [Planctomycetota bacterium]
MSTNNVVFTRREFLRTSAVVSTGLTLPAFLTGWRGLAQAEEPGAGGRILVVLQLGGGNDGLNTLVPYTDDAYRRARPALALPKDRVLDIDGRFGFNDSLAALKGLFDDGKVAVVHGVGYPNPDRSHFRSMDIWHTASDSDRYETTGWLGRYFHNCCGGKPDPVTGVNVGAKMPMAFAGSDVGVSFTNPAWFRWLPGDGADTEKAFRELNTGKAEGTLDYLRAVSSSVVATSDKVQAVARKRRAAGDYPQSRFADDLHTVANMILGGLPARIYYVSMTGFDTHAGQAGTQERLLKEFAEGVKAFHGDLAKAGAADRVLMMSFSEFGRRVEENASGGTDHGTAGPMFVIGDGAAPGLKGASPKLTDLDQGDLKHTVDFRAVYGEVVSRWLGGDAKQVLGRDLQPLGVVREG